MRSPVDVSRCQAVHELTNVLGDGEVDYVRCFSRPVALVHEMKIQEDGSRGAMSMCQQCYDLFLKANPQLSKEDYRTTFLL